jgi:hypothetical protein
LLNGSKVVDEYAEYIVDYGLAGRAASAHSSEIRPPDGHLPTAMRRDNGPSIDLGGDLVDGETPAMPLHNLRQIGRGRLERGGGGAIATALYAMARATVL